jgi:hypothetical protein
MLRLVEQVFGAELMPQISYKAALKFLELDKLMP